MVDLDLQEVVDPEHPSSKKFLSYCDQKCDESGLLHRDAIMPAELGSDLVGAFIVELVDGGEDALYRLVGTEIEERTGVRFTGRRIREVYTRDGAESLLPYFRRTALGQERITIQGQMLGINLEHARFEATMSPLLGRDGQTVMIIGIFFGLDTVGG